MDQLTKAPQALDAWRGRWVQGTRPEFVQTLLQVGRKRDSASIFVGIYYMIAVDLSVRSIEGGEKLCEAYEIYGEWERIRRSNSTSVCCWRLRR